MAAAAVLLPAAWVVIRGRMRSWIHPIQWVIVFYIITLIAQYCAGIIGWFGGAWISGIYLVSALFCFYIGQKWELDSPGQPMTWITSAFLIVAIVSLPIQVMQWMGLSWDSALIMKASDPSRPYANVGQPNLLADAYLIALIGLSYLFEKVKLSGVLTFMAASIVLVGIAMTGSRAGALGVSLLIALRVYKGLLGKNWIVVVCCLVLVSFFLIVSLILPSIQHVYLNPEVGSGGRGFASVNHRLEGWEMIARAVLNGPWYGFGWGQITRINYDQLPDSERAVGIFSQSHNIFLDFVAWLGLPVGLIGGFAVAYLYSTLIWKSLWQHGHMVAIVVVLAIHAQLEFPLHHMMFLVPFFFASGAISVVELPGSRFSGSRIWGCVFFLATVAAYIVTARDYFNVERAQYALRFELKNIPHEYTGYSPDVWVLTHLQRNIELSRMTVEELSSQVNLEEAERLITIVPNQLLTYKVARAYELLGNSKKFFVWKTILCKTTPTPICNQATLNNSE